MRFSRDEYMSDEIEVWLSDDPRGLEHFLGADRSADHEFRRLAESVTSDRDLAVFLFKLSAEVDGDEDRGGG